MERSIVEWLSIAGSVASLVGILIAAWTLYKVENLPAALKRQSRDRQMTDLIDKINRVPPAKPALPDSTARDVEIVLRTIRLYYVSNVPFRHRGLKALIGDLESELRGGRRLEVVQHLLRLIRDEITIR